MRLINGLLTMLPFVSLTDIFATFFLMQKSKCNLNDSSIDEEPSWTWKDTLWMGIMLISCVTVLILAMFLSIYFKSGVIWMLFVLSGLFKQATTALPSAEIVGTIISGKSQGNLNRNEHFAIQMLALSLTYLQIYNVPEKLYSFAIGYPDYIRSDWMIIAFYVFSLAILSFLICSLAVSPMKLLLHFIGKVFSLFPLQRINPYISKLQTFTTGNINTKTYTAAIIDSSMKSKTVFKLLLWILTIPAAVFDITRLVIRMVLVLGASILWYVILIISQICNLFKKVGTKLIAISDSGVVAISFRVAVIFGLGCTVIINRYQPFLHNQAESTAVLEFISSVLIIPLVLEWILSYKKPTPRKTHR